MDRFAVDQGLKDYPVEANRVIQHVNLQPPKGCEALIAPPCFELSFTDAGETLATIATLIDAGLAMPDALEPRLCERCGAWHARRIRRNGTGNG